MFSVCFSFLILSSQLLSYEPGESPLNGSGLRGLRPIVQAETVVSRLGEDWLLVFSAWTNDGTSLYSRRWITKKEEWSEPLRVSGEEARSHSFPHIWVDSRQVVHCVWQSRQDREFVVLYAQLPVDSDEWSKARKIEGAGGVSRWPVGVAGDSKGNLFIWSHNRRRTQRFAQLQLFASTDSGLTWQPLEPFQTLRGKDASFFEPRLALSDDDEVFVTALRAQGSISVLLTSSPDAGHSWTTPMMLNEKPSHRISHPQLLIGGDVVHVTWLDQPSMASTKRLEAALLGREEGAFKLQRVLVQSLERPGELSYSTWRKGQTVGVTWLEKFNSAPSRVRQRRTLANGRIDLTEALTLAVSRDGFHFEELATAGDPDIFMVTEKKLLSRSKLMACAKAEKGSWDCENLHIASGEFDILAPVLVEIGEQKVTCPQERVHSLS